MYFARLKQCADRYRELEDRLQDPALHEQPGAMQAVLREMATPRAR